MLFQNTAVTRGTAIYVVTATGAATEMGKIAGMLTSVARSRSPLQKELDGVTKWLGLVSWVAVAVIVENGGHGGAVAAPIARTIMDAWLLENPA